MGPLCCSTFFMLVCLSGSSGECAIAVWFSMSGQPTGRLNTRGMHRPALAKPAC